MISLLCLFVALVVSHFGFEGRTLVLIASVPGHCDYLLLEYTLFFRKRSIPALDIGYRTVSLLHFHPACNVFYLRTETGGLEHLRSVEKSSSLGVYNCR